MEHEHASERATFWKSPFGVVCTLVAVAASAYLWLVHRDHVLALLPYAFLAACLLTHMLMHRGQHGHQHRGAQQPDRRGSRDS